MTDQKKGYDSNGSEQRLLGVVLAGGRSSRMGRDKALLPHPRGGTLLEYVAALVGSRCRHLIISGQQSLPGVPTLPDPVQDQGPAIGVMAAVQEARRLQLAAALIVPIDMPHIVPDDLQPLIDAWERQPQQVVAASFAEHFPEPLLAIYPICLLDGLRDLAASQHRSLSRWLSQQSCCLVPLPSRASANLNTMEQWKRFQIDQL